MGFWGRVGVAVYETPRFLTWGFVISDERRQDILAANSPVRMRLDIDHRETGDPRRSSWWHQNTDLRERRPKPKVSESLYAYK